MPQQPMTKDEVVDKLKESRKRNGNVSPAASKEFTEKRRKAELNRDLNEHGLNLEDLQSE